jgi:5-methylcytosine-specific restriction endonuclease McrA
MDEMEGKFVRLYAIEGKKYADIEKALHCDRARVRELFNRTADERKLVHEAKQIRSRKKIKKSFSQFYSEYEKLKKECCYCGMTPEQLDLLFAQKKIRTKRRATRGRRLELERVEPNASYEDADNLRLACYWCNNAKSDEFTMEEFKLIGEQIGKALKARLRKS